MDIGSDSSKGSLSFVSREKVHNRSLNKQDIHGTKVPCDNLVGGHVN
jgi:hypothetical protein